MKPTFGIGRALLNAPATAIAPYAGNPFDLFGYSAGDAVEGLAGGEGWLTDWVANDVPDTRFLAEDDLSSYTNGTSMSGLSGGSGWSGGWSQMEATKQADAGAPTIDVIQIDTAFGLGAAWRKLAIGTDWTRIRLISRIRCEDTGGAIGSTPRIAIGICSGTTNPYQGDTDFTDHFVGLCANDATWSRFSDRYNADMDGLVRVGTTNTFAGSTGVGWIPHTGTSVRYAPFLVDITKGSPNFTVFACVSAGATSSFGDVSLADMTPIAANPEATFSGAALLGSWSMAVDEATNGYLDTFNIMWAQSNYCNFRWAWVFRFK